jgi:hypothetical protein
VFAANCNAGERGHKTAFRNPLAAFRNLTFIDLLIICESYWQLSGIDGKEL